MSLKRQGSTNLAKIKIKIKKRKKKKEKAFPAVGIACTKALRYDPAVVSGSLNISALKILLPSQHLSACAAHNCASALPEYLPSPGVRILLISFKPQCLL